jgi:transcription antitermination factor NusA-like protein
LIAASDLARYHEKIQRFVDREHRAIDQHQIPAQLLFNRLAAGGQAPCFHVRGRMNDVNALNAKLAAFLEQEKKDELERGYTTHLEYPHKYASFLIGKRGDNINRLQEEFDVELNYQEGKVELKGPKAKCDACKSHIASMVKKLEDETTHSIKVAPQYHGSLKGPKGTQVLRLQDRYNVRINFPRAASSPADDADAGTEGSFRNHHQQAPDVVTIKGPKKGADEAKDEILNLLQYLVDHGHSAVVSMAAKQIPSLIGSGGRELENLREQSGGCNIDIPKRDTIDASGRVEVKLRGTKQQVEAAKKILAERAKVFDNTVTKLLPVDPALYRTIIGPNGSNIQRIVAEAGGPDDQRAINRMVQFPKQGSDDRNIHISGPSSTVEKITKAIMALADGRKGFVTESVPVPHEKHRLLVGAGGSARRKIETDFSVELQVPRAASDKGGSDEHKPPAAVTLTGNPDNIAKARAHIEALLKEQSTATVQVPRHLHHLVSDDGAIFRKLRNELGVTVDHAGARPPPRPQAAGPKRGGRPAGAGAMPLITDDPEQAADSHAWELVASEPAAEADAGDAAKTIPWALRGSEEKVARAREMIERAVERAGKPTATGYLVLPDARLYRYVIGQSGATVNGIRAKTGTAITVPRQGGGGGEGGVGEAIEIRGEAKGVEEARDLILEAVRAAKERGGGRGRGA